MVAKLGKSPSAGDGKRVSAAGGPYADPMDAIFADAGSLRTFYETADWVAAGVGPAESWSPTLRSAVDLMLHTRFPMTLMWGSQFTMLYNEAYVRLIADKHPRAFGAPAERVFPEIWPFIGPMLREVYGGGPATFQQDSGMLLERGGLLEECYFTFSFSPSRGRSGTVEGVFAIAAETTRTTIDRRRLALLVLLNAVIADLRDGRELRARALPLLRGVVEDLPEVDIVALDSSGTVACALELPATVSPGARAALVEGATPGGIVWLRLGESDGGAGDTPLALRVRLSEHLPVDEPYLDFLGLVASALSQALSRAHSHTAERRVAQRERSMSETLQRSLLTEPVQSETLQVAVRYQAAVEQAQVGGDWYDSFVPPSGALTLVVGDVSGHDQHAAGTMGQVRNLLRGVALTLDEPPSRVLRGLDEAMHHLAIGAFATAVLARVEPDQTAAGLRTLRWSNAGHPPPILIGPDGAARLLESPPEVMLGVTMQEGRSDHSVSVEPGSTVVLYTDGLVERRDASLDEGLDHLIGFLDGQAHLGAELLCDRLLAEFGAGAEDDIVLLVLRVHADGGAPAG